MRRLFASLALAGLCVLAVGIARPYLAPRAGFSAEQRNLLRAKGEPSAPLWIVEYLDYQCPSCREAHRRAQGFLERHPAEAYLQVRFFPLAVHRYALKSSLYAECAARQGKFWPFHEALLEKREEWSQAPLERVDALFGSYAAAVKLDLKRLGACVSDPAVKETVFAETQAAREAGVRSTPTFFIKGEMVVGPEALEEKWRQLDRLGKG